MVNEKEKMVIVELRKNSRQTVREISEKYGYPISTLFDMLHKLEKTGTLKHTSKVNFEKIGYPIKLFANVKTDYSGRDQLRQYLLQQKNINSLHLINSPSNFHLEAIFKNQGEAYKFIDDLNQKNRVVSCDVYNVLDTLHTDQFLTDEKHFE